MRKNARATLVVLVGSSIMCAATHAFAADSSENQIDSIRRTVEWFDKYLKGGAAAPAGAQAGR